MILIDNRVGSRELAPHISPPSKLTRLSYADFSFMGNGPDGISSIGIERKTITDLLSSISSGRLSGHQLIGLLSSYDYVYLLIEGIWKPRDHDGVLEHYRRGGWKPIQLGQRHFISREVSNYVNTLAITCGIKVWFTQSRKQSGRWIGDLWHWWDKDWDKHTAHRQFHVEPPNNAMLRKPSIMHRIVKELPSVGWDRAKHIVEVYKSLKDLMGATEKELMEIDGIGKGMAAKIHRALREGE